jgi:3-methyladenine DNA glycosylase AlkD
MRPQPDAAAIVAAVRDGLAAAADPAAAPQMQRYMKSAMPFRGVPKPGRERLLRAIVAAHPAAGPEILDTAVRTLWDGARFREERYLSIALSGLPQFPRDPGRVPLYRHWIVTGAWWDLTDEIAVKRVGPLLRAHPSRLTPVLRGWATDADRWLRRCAVICQVGSRDRTDPALLAAAVEATIDDPDFFLRKAIGWALRQYARTDPGWVRAFVEAHPRLSALSRREALRHL